MPGDKQITLSHHIEPDLTLVRGNYDLLLQVFVNLVGNALKFTEAGGHVAIRAYCLRQADDMQGMVEYVRIEVADTGMGIAQEDQAAIFDRFFRVENRVHTLEGTGLGLSIVKNIIEKHGSQVHLISEVGIGTTFWFDLAASPAEAEGELVMISHGSQPDPMTLERPEGSRSPATPSEAS
jgi:two-component system sensor histidine kinase NblS